LAFVKTINIIDSIEYLDGFLRASTYLSYASDGVAAMGGACSSWPDGVICRDLSLRREGTQP
jgi:hypothetical protein